MKYYFFVVKLLAYAVQTTDGYCAGNKNVMLH